MGELMESLPLLLLFWYGVLHAFGPDHLTAIVDFSIGKSKMKTLFITFAFAIGHGISLFIFAKLLQKFNLSKEILAYGDVISSIIIILIGLFLLFMAITNKIAIGWHEHKGQKHIHIYFAKEHTHSDSEFKGRIVSALSIGALMGIGGVRGMLITLSAISHNEVNFKMVFSFTLGVLAVFMLFGYFLAIINENLLKTKKNVRIAFGIAGIISLVVGSNILL
jgi:ABC-type nickel/cobalt efflux system permease component RcnA